MFLYLLLASISRLFICLAIPESYHPKLTLGMKQKNQNSYRIKHADKVPYHFFGPYKTRAFLIPRAVMNDKNFTLHFYMTASAQVVKKV